MIKVMIVEDSALMRNILRDIITRNKNMEIISTARDGIDALEKLKTFKPDVITLDVNMPRMDGISTLVEIKKRHNIPVIMLSSLTAKNSKITIEALAEGAYDFVEKPSGDTTYTIDEMEEDLISKIENVKKISSLGDLSIRRDKSIPEELKLRQQSEVYPLLNKNWSAITIGASTGGPKAISDIIGKIPKNINSIPIFIAQHMPKGFTATFAERLDSICPQRVKEGQDGELIKKGHIYVAPGDYHMTIDGNYIALDKRDKHLGVRPAVDFLFKSAAVQYKDRLLSIILTGMGRDGTEGMKWIRKYQGINIAQDQESSVIFGMPGSAIKNNVVDQVLPLEEISDQIRLLLKG